MKKFLVISAAVSLMSTAAFAASSTPSTTATGVVAKAGVHNFSIPVAVTVQRQRAHNTALFGSVAASNQSQDAATISTSTQITGSALIH